MKHSQSRTIPFKLEQWTREFCSFDCSLSESGLNFEDMIDSAILDIVKNK